MLRGVTSQSETRRCQKLLGDTLDKGLNLQVCLKIGYPGGSGRYSVKHNRIVWFTSEKHKGKKFWNAFGLKPDKNKQNDIVAEINIPIDGINLSIGAGMFAVDEKGSIFLLHSGRIGGGYPGINKTNFLAWYSQFDSMIEVENGTKVEKGILIGNVSQKEDLINGLIRYLRDVEYFKQLVRDPSSLNEGEVIRGHKGKPNKREIVATTYERNPKIAELAKRMANGKCRLCGKKGPFKDNLGRPFLETHHVKWLSNGGKDSIDNIVALCPNCHRKMHYLDNKQDRDRLTRIATSQRIS